MLRNARQLLASAVSGKLKKIIEMDINELKTILVRCIDKLYQKDLHLIRYNLNERSISHKLALYLTEELKESELDIDCEYNGDLENSISNYRKRIEILSDDLKEIGKEVKNNEELQSLAVYPDIIIHKRGVNKENSLIIEIKKEYPGRTVDDKFDRMKLYHYTSEYHGNNMKYKLGAYIEFDTLTDQKSYRLDFYQNGSKI